MTDIKISSTCVVRKQPKGNFGKRFELRVGEDGWHKEAALLTPDEAYELHGLLSAFLQERRS